MCVYWGMSSHPRRHSQSYHNCRLMCFIAIAGLALITPESDFWLIAFALLVVGIGNGIFNAPNGLASSE